jgi:large repetitive protein
MNPTHRISRFITTVFMLATLLIAGVAHGQLNEPMEATWVANGPVFAVESNASALYLGGNFTYVGPSTGSVVRLQDDGLLATAPAFPKVNGTVYAMVSDGAGGWYIGGDFTRVGDELRNRIAHVLVDGSVAAWNPNINNTVYALAVSTDGLTVYAGGAFTRIGSLTRRYLASIDAVTGLATTWDPALDAFVRTMTLSADGLTLFAGGNFTDFIKAYDLSVFPPVVSFTPIVDGMVRTMALTPDGSKLFMGGWFTDHLIAIDPATGGLDAVFNPVVNNPVLSLAATDAEVYAGGSFTEVNYETRNGIVALDAATGDNIADWAPEADNWVTALAVSPDGVTVYAGGDFTVLGGEARQHIARLDAVGEGDGTGRAIPAWDPGAGNTVYVLNAVDESGDEYLYAGGAFTTVNGVVRNNLAALDADALSPTYGEALAWDPGADGTVYALAMDSAGITLFAGGMFSNVSGIPASHIASLNPADDSIVFWASSGVNNTVRTLALRPDDGLLYVGGDFTVINGTARTYCAALNAGAGNVEPWNPNANAPVNAIAASNSVVYAGGEFTSIGGQSRNYLAALFISGLDTGWTMPANYPVHALALTSTFDKLYVGGEFTIIGGQPRNRLAVLDTVGVGAVFPWTDLGFNGTVECLLLDEGKETLWVGGNFVSPQLRLAAVDLNPLFLGNLAAWDPRADNPVYDFDQTVTGTSIYAGGAFTTVGGNAFSGLGGVSRSYLGHFVLRPVITLTGLDPVTLECSVDTYVEANATALDAAGNDLTPFIVIGGDVVDETMVGTYVITYNVTDSGGNPALEVTRTVNVVDTIPPTITLTGNAAETVECSVPYADAGATALDTCDGDLAGAIVTVNPVDVGVVGAYTITYDVADASANAAVQVTRSVTVVDTTPPVITLLGATPVTTELTMAYVDAGATAADTCDGNLTGSIVTVNPVDINTVGTYTITYDVSDAAANAAVQVTRTVNVVDTSNPYVVSITVDSNQTILVTFNKDMGVGVTDPLNYIVSGPGIGTFAANPDSVATIDPANYQLTWNCPATMFGGQNVTITVNTLVEDIYGNTVNPVANTGTDVAMATLPAITVTGANPETVECAGVYADAGATATDGCGTAITASIVTVNPVNTAVAGAYTVTYDVTDAAGNAAAQATRTVNVTDTTVPVITLSGADPVVVECGTAYVDAGATAADVCDGDLTTSIVTTNPVDTGVPGTYTMRYNVSDAAANAAVEATRTVTVTDTTIPVITITGSDPETVECGSAYTDVGATATDVCDGDLTASIVVVDGVNTAAVGSYTVSYDVSDASSNVAVQVTRTVNVIDTTAPVITLVGNNPETADCGVIYTDAGATASDACDGDLTASIVDVDSVNTAIIGSYTVTYDVSDAASNAAVQITRTVNVVDVTGPVITLNGANPMTVECNTAYVEPNATALDDCEGDLTASIVVDNTTVDTTIVGSYSVTYNVSDGLGNAGAEVIRTVDVVDAAAPVITLLGVTPVLLECGDAYADAGATALDGCDGDLSAGVVTLNPVNTAVAGTYTVTYNVSDGASNAAAEVTRTVNVVDSTAPVITLLGNVIETVECGDAYADAGATAVDVCDGDLTAAIVVVNAVNTGAAGAYTITYNVSDGAGNGAAEVTRTVNVIDTTAPVISLIGLPAEVVECGAGYADAGATALDICDGDLTPAITTVSTVNDTLVGSYTVTYDVTDGAGNAATQVVRTVDVVDTTPPLITLLGNGVETVECTDVYTDAGATALDDCDGDLTGAVATVNPVNTSLPGIYMVTYNVSDAAGLAALQVERTVNVVDTTAPVIMLIGDPVVTTPILAPYIDQGATASDVCFGDLTGAIVTLNPVITALVGSYIVAYDVFDGVGNAAVQVQRTVYVVDPALPYVDQVQVMDPIRVRVRFNRDMGGNDLNPLDYTVSGTGQGMLPPNPIGVIPVDPFTYDLTWGCPLLMRNGGDITITVAGTVADSIGNLMTAPFARTHLGGAIAAAPMITLVGVPIETVECGAIYADAGATAADACGTDISGAIAALNPVNTSVVGSYTVTYNVNDAAGNSAAEVTRTVDVVDTTAPVITLVGLAAETTECGIPYVDAGATALDDCDGDLTGILVVDNQVDTAIPGVYVVNFDVTDAAGIAAATVTRTVTVTDTTPPVITLTGNVAETVECGDTYTDAGATALDACEGDLTASIITVNPVNTGAPGVYSITYDVSDTAANAAVQVTRTVTVEDTTLPVITLNGNATETVECSDIYTDAGATAADVCDGDLTISITTVNSVNTAAVGTYTVTYDVSDASGNAAVQVVRTVNVVDTAAPVITLVGATEVSVDQGTGYGDAGVAALDDCEGDLTGSVVTVNPVDTAIIGTYTVTYNVTDASGNAAAEVSRTVFVVDPTRPFLSSVTVTGPRTVVVVFSKNMGAMALDALNYTLTGSGAGALQANPDGVIGANDTYTLTWACPDIMLDGGDITITVDAGVADDAANTMSAPLDRTDFGGAVAAIPVITLTGVTPVTVECGDTYTDAGATAEDECLTDVTGAMITVNPVDTGIVGSYTITYNVTDAAGNMAAEVTRTVDVVDTTAPVIALTGTTPVTVECSSIYTDDGATALDACDGDLTAAITTANPVDSGIVGVYTVTYDVADAAANAATQVTRTVNVVDTTAPVITLTGTTPVTVECSNAYTDEGATALDNCDGDLTATIVVVNPVNAAVVGSYTVTYNVSDIASNAAAEVTRTVNVVDTTTPVITLAGAPTITVECGDTYTDAGATALDDCDGDLTLAITTVNPVNTGVVGVYTVTYNVSDAASNAATEVTRTVNVVDTTAPVITLGGASPVTMECGDTYTDAGATAADACGGDLTSSIVTLNPVDTGIAGTYTVTYNVSDAASNVATEVTRTVNVTDTTAPVITLGGISPVTVECGDVYTDAGATANDACDGDLSASIVTVNPVNSGIVGTYTVTYNVSDAATNAATEVTRTINVVDTTAPVITRLGNATETVECGDTYTDAGATANDACDGDLTASIVTANPVNTGFVGSYTVTYNVSDAASNAAVEVTRTVNVVDTTAPVLTLLGDTLVITNFGVGYTDAGATALDACGGDLTTSIVTVNPVNTAVLGEYTVTYDVSDAASNAAMQMQRTVYVVDPTLPYVEQVTVQDENTVRVVFNKAMDITAEDSANYTVSGSGMGSLQANPVSVTEVDPVTYDLIWGCPYIMLQGGDITITVADGVLDDVLNPIIMPKERTHVGGAVATMPTITLNGGTPVVVECGDTYTDAGATASDRCGNDLTPSIVTVNPVATGIPGSYTITYNVVDGAGNAAAEVVRNVDVVDTTPPAISLLGSDPVTVECGDTYTDAGATATDVCDGDLTASLVTVNPVDTAVLGTYVVTYNVTDSAGLAAAEMIRTVNVVDNALPVITLTGSDPVTVECDTAYTDAGATATDVCDGDLTASLVTVNPVNTLLPGTYTVTYNITDGAGNAALEVTRTVDVTDTTAPTLTLDVFPPAMYDIDGYLLHECSTAFVEPAGFVATDTCNGDLGAVQNALVVDTPGVAAYAWALSAGELSWLDFPTRIPDVRAYDAFIATPGDYLIYYVAQDGANNTYPPLNVDGLPDIYDGSGLGIGIDALDFARLVRVADTDAPILTLQGTSPLTVECGSVYADAGATAADVCDGDLSSAIAVAGDVVNPNVVGSYLITYNVSDLAGNAAAEVTRTVDVVDSLQPVLALTGSNPMPLECGNPYVEPGATALDQCDGDLTSSIVIAGSVNINLPGNYAIQYEVSDAVGNVATEFRTVQVSDTQPPVISLIGDNPLLLECKDVIIDPGATAADTCDGDLTASITMSNDIDTAVPGDYEMRYNVTDGTGNAAATVIRTVSVTDTQAPVITLNGTSPMDVNCDDTYVEAGATATDTCDGDLTAAITIGGSVLNGTPGAYTITYNVNDGAGNAATEVTRTVNILNNCSKANPSAFNIAFELDERFEVYDLDDNGTLDQAETAAAYYVLQQIYPDLDQSTYNEIVEQLSGGTGSLNEAQVSAFVEAHDAPCSPDETAPSVLFKDITLDLDEAGQASLFDANALYSTAAVTYLYDNCLGDGAENLSAFAITATQEMFSCDDVGDVEVTLTVSDTSNNTASGMVTVTVTKGAATCTGRCGCTGGCNKSMGIGDYRKMLADWLLIGLTLTCLYAFSTLRKH